MLAQSSLAIEVSAITKPPPASTGWLVSAPAMPSDFFSRRIAAPFGVPFFLWFFCLALWGAPDDVCAAEDVVTQVLIGSDFKSAHDALIEAIEADGLVVSAMVPFNGMLIRTAKDLAQEASPFVEAEIIQFCSSVLAWQMIAEDPAQLSMCPLSIAIYATATESGKIMMAYRSPGRASVARARGEDRKSTRLNSSHITISYAVFCLKK